MIHPAPTEWLTEEQIAELERLHAAGDYLSALKRFNAIPTLLAMAREALRLKLDINTAAYERDRNAAERDKAEKERDRISAEVEQLKVARDNAEQQHQDWKKEAQEMGDEVKRLREAVGTAASLLKFTSFTGNMQIEAELFLKEYG